MHKTGLYCIAEKHFSIQSFYKLVHEKCSEYGDCGNPEFEIEIFEDDIEKEKQIIKDENISGISSAILFDDYLETLVVHRKIAEKMPFFNTVLFHGSCIAVDGNGYLFTAASGTGKSTHARLWRELLGERAVMVNDDKPLIKICEDGVIAYGTPWNGKHRLGNNMSAPLGAICIIKRATENAIRESSYEEAYPMLMQQCYRPSDREAMERTLELLDRMAKLLRFYELRCNISEEAARLSYGTMSGNLGGMDQ